MTTPINPERLEDETFNDYKERRKRVNKAIKKHRKGQAFVTWDEKGKKQPYKNEKNGNM
jgi:hypothetical protein